VKAHGGYLCRVENFDSIDLAALAREAVLIDGGSGTGGLELSWIPKRKIARLSPDLRARGGAAAGWFESHHALAKLLSLRTGATVHAYLLDPEWGEQVAAYGAGRRVGGEQVRYADVDLALDGMDDEAFEALQSRWPLGHLAYVFGVPRSHLLALGTTPPASVIALRPARSDAA
jgi:hypothetical protein